MGQLECQKEGGPKKTAGSGQKKYQFSWLKHPDPGCPKLGDGPE